MKKASFENGDKRAFVYSLGESESPLIVLNEYMGDGQGIVDKLLEQCRGEKITVGAVNEDSASEKEAFGFNLLVVSGLDWDRDMSPWYCAPVFPGEGAYEGKADVYLALLLEEIIPEAKKLLEGEPASLGIAGYSLAGLFALYSLYRCSAFDCAASMSGSLWFPGFVDFVREHDMKTRPDKIYLSLGSKEARTRHPYMKEVQTSTEQIAEIYKEQGLDVTWELNPGNHFRDVEERCEKGLQTIADIHIEMMRKSR